MMGQRDLNLTNNDKYRKKQLERRTALIKMELSDEYIPRKPINDIKNISRRIDSPKQQTSLIDDGEGYYTHPNKKYYVDK